MAFDRRIRPGDPTGSWAALDSKRPYSARTRNKMSDRRELYRSPNGDTWFLGREPTDGHAFIIHQPNAPAGSRRSHIELGEFLRTDPKAPEQKALLRLIATLVDVPPFA